MNHGNFILREPEYEVLLSALRKLLVDASAKVVFLVDKDGTLLASAGDAVGFDTTSLASLAAGNIAATGGLANLIGEKEFSILFHEGERDNMHLSVVAALLGRPCPPARPPGLGAFHRCHGGGAGRQRSGDRGSRGVDRGRHREPV
jgi:hypothetical protein